MYKKKTVLKQAWFDMYCVEFVQVYVGIKSGSLYAAHVKRTSQLLKHTVAAEIFLNVAQTIAQAWFRLCFIDS